MLPERSLLDDANEEPSKKKDCVSYLQGRVNIYYM